MDYSIVCDGRDLPSKRKTEEALHLSTLPPRVRSRERGTPSARAVADEVDRRDCASDTLETAAPAAAAVAGPRSPRAEKIE